MGVEVASFGDYFADRQQISKSPQPKKHGRPQPSGPAESLVYNDPFGGIYKKFIFTSDGKYLLGGILVGETDEYVKMVSIVKKKVRTHSFEPLGIERGLMSVHHAL
jgi:nitrite reductase (NAD(P)H)